MYTDDPTADFEDFDWQQQKELERLPCCEICSDKIQDSFAFHVYGCWYHKDCFESEFLQEVVL